LIDLNVSPTTPIFLSIVLVQNTYYVAPEEEIPAEVTARDERQFGYYQVEKEKEEDFFLHSNKNI
jgi:hypothetical protein